jgi:hypothetical protein
MGDIKSAREIALEMAEKVEICPRRGKAGG